MSRTPVIASVVLATLLSACASEQPTVAEQLGESIFGEAPAIPEIDRAAAAEGEVLYRANCAVCHGADLAGAPDWRVPDEKGRYKPPPMDSTGHTWHHSDQLLTDIVLNGSPDQKSAMRGFSDRLSTDDVAAILAFFKSRWGPDERRFQWTVTWQESQRG